MPTISNVIADPVDCAASALAGWRNGQRDRSFAANSSEGNRGQDCRGMPMFRSLLSACLSGFAASFRQLQSGRPSRDSSVIISFDGAHDNALWLKSREMAGEKRRPFHLFPFLHFLMNEAAEGLPGAPETRKIQCRLRPERRRDRSASAISGTPISKDMKSSHACGHFDGRLWSEADWSAEYAIKTFHATLKNAGKSVDWGAGRLAGSVDHGITVFAPPISRPRAHDRRREAAGFTYDASLVTKGPAMPVEEDGIIRFGLPLIPEGPERKPVIGMDYNLFVRHSKGEKDTAKIAEFEDAPMRPSGRLSTSNMPAHRIPLQLGFHFVEMNGGAYWRALDRFARRPAKADVACVSYLANIWGARGKRR